MMMRKFRLKYLILFFIYNMTIAQTLQWQQIGRMPLPVSGHRAIALDSVILIIGGFSDSLNTPVNLIQEYNPYTKQWRIIGTTKYKRVYFLSSKNGDSLFVFGGISRSIYLQDYYTLEIWKKNSQSYIYRYNPIFNRIFSAGMLIDNKFYLFGGRKAYHHYDTTKFNFLVEYDLLTDSVLFTIERFPNTPEIPFNQTICRLKDNIFVFGGVSIGILNSIYKLNLINKSFSRVPLNLFGPRAGAEAIELNDNSIIVIGGYNEQFKALRTTEIFNYNSQSFSIEIGPAMNYARRNFAAVKFNNSIYVFGGENQFNESVPYIEKLDLTTTAETDEFSIPKEIYLEQNYPNPFNPTTTISFKIPKNSKVLLEIFDIFGKRIKTLLNSELNAGKYSFEWNGTDENGNQVASGIYFYRLIAGKNSITKKMTLIR